MSPRIRFHPTDAISLAKVLYLILEQTKAGLVLQQVDNPSVTRSFKPDEVVALLAAPNTRLRRGYFSGHKAVSRLRNGQKYLATVPEKARSKALWKGVFVRVYLDWEQDGKVNRTEASIRKSMVEMKSRVDEMCAQSQHIGKPAQAGAEIKSRKAPSPRALLTWVRRFEASQGCPLSLLRKHRSTSTYARKFSRDVVKLLNECIWEFLSDGQPSKRKVIRDTQDRFKEENQARRADGLPELHVPSATDIERRINRFKRFHKKAARHGVSAAQRDMSIYEGGLKISHPLQWVEMDEWAIDVFSLLDEAGFFDGMSVKEKSEYDIGRRWLYLAIDVATRCIVGFRLAKTQSSADAISTVSLITMDKTPLARAAGCESEWPFFGGCGSISTDMGPAFVADDYRIAVTDLGFNQVAPVAGVPKLRGHVERMFGTLASQLMPELTGRSFANPQERGDYPGEERAALTDDDLIKLFTRFIVDIYHNVPHAGLNEETPANAWARLAKEQGVSAPPDATARCSVFGVPLQRKIGRHGVLANGIHYLSEELEDAYLEGVRDAIEVRVDPHDVTFVTVCLDGEWYPAKAVSAEVWGLSLFEWLELVGQLRIKHKKEAELTEDVVRRARQAIRKINADAMALRRLAPITVTTDDLERAEREVFMSLTIRPARTVTPIKDAPAGQGLLGDVISPQEPTKETGYEQKAIKPSKGWGFRHD